MTRSKLIFGLMALCVLASACEKAKMRTVAPKDPNASASADPGFPSPSSELPQNDVQEDSMPEPTEPVVSNTPLPEPPRPVTRLDGVEESEDTEVAEVPEVRESSEGPLRRPVKLPSRPDCCRVEVAPNCRPDQVIVRERVPRARPVPVREEVIIDQRELDLGLAADLHCRWEPTAKPITYLRFDPIKKIAWVSYGWPKKWSQYTGVRLVSGLPPYLNEGLTLVTRTGVPIASLKGTGNGTIWTEQNTKYPYETYFGDVPGGSANRKTRGVCWTKEEPAKTDDRR